MRNLCNYTTLVLSFITLFIVAPTTRAEFYGFNKITVNQDFKTTVEFDQDDFKNYKATDNLKLRVMEGNEIIREDAILNKGGMRVWSKVLPFSENLKFFILKDGEPISGEYVADTKSSLSFSTTDKSNKTPPMIRGVHYLPAIPVENNNQKKRLPIDLKALKNCKDKVLVIVFDKENNTLLWQAYDELKNLITTDEIELSKNMRPTMAIVTDEGSCGQ
jgi:hypothetical protein